MCFIYQTNIFPSERITFADSFKANLKRKAEGETILSSLKSGISSKPIIVNTIKKITTTQITIENPNGISGELNFDQKQAKDITITQTAFPLHFIEIIDNSFGKFIKLHKIPTVLQQDPESLKIIKAFDEKIFVQKLLNDSWNGMKLNINEMKEEIKKINEKFKEINENPTCLEYIGANPDHDILRFYYTLIHNSSQKVIDQKDLPSISWY